MIKYIDFDVASNCVSKRACNKNQVQIILITLTENAMRRKLRQ